MEQVPMCFSRRGGARVGAGRRKKKDAGVPHGRRPRLTGRDPIHVTLRLCDEVLRLRSRRCFAVVCAALAAGCDRWGFRVVSCSVQGSHLHLLVEAADTGALSRGMQGLTIRIAKGLNKLMGRKGKVFEERYHEHVLRTPREVRAAQAYVFGNRANHAARLGRPLRPGFRDPFTLGYFGPTIALPVSGPRLVAGPRTWLLREGWRKKAWRQGTGRDQGTARLPWGPPLGPEDPGRLLANAQVLMAFAA